MSNGRRSPWLAVVVSCAIATIVIGFLILGIYLLDYWGWLDLGLTEVDYDNRIKYLLSATAQVLGALFALVFSITLIAVQFVTKYTHRTMRIIFNNKIIFYMITFALSVAVPLLWLMSPTWGGGIMAIVVGVIIILSLVPFFLYLRDSMKIEHVTNHLKDKGLRAFKRNDTDEVSRKTRELDLIGIGSLGDQHYETFGAAIEALFQFGLGIEQITDEIQSSSDDIKARKEIFNTLRDYCRVENPDPRTLRLLVENTGVCGAEAIKKRCLQTENDCINLVMHVRRLTLDKDCGIREENRIRLSVYSALALKTMTDSVPQKHETRKKELMEKVTEIFNDHFVQNWKDWLSTFLQITFDFLTKPDKYPIDTHEFWSRLLEHFFKYPVFFADHDMTNEATTASNKINKLLDYIRKERNLQVDLTKPFLDGLKLYVQKYFSKRGKVWKGWAENICREAVKLSKEFLNRKEHDVSLTALMVYMPAIGEHHITKETLRSMYPNFISQISEYITKSNKSVESDTTAPLVRALYESLSLEPIAFKVLWSKIETIILSLLKPQKASMELESFYSIYTDFTISLMRRSMYGDLKEQLSLENVFQFTWLVALRVEPIIMSTGALPKPIPYCYPDFKENDRENLTKYLNEFENVKTRFTEFNINGQRAEKLRKDIEDAFLKRWAKNP
ncbi:hypothetical protein JXM67_03240 [candidate division WOR-3 bacterium]|nr:hypothetical protein [candidate division WOR-3 bacterium]